MYTFNAVRWGQDITRTARTFAELCAILDRWLVWDEGDGYMRCAPESVTRDNGQRVGSDFLYAISHGNKSYAQLRHALRTPR
jgi:hypothetical protein